MLADVAERPQNKYTEIERLHGLLGETGDALGRKHLALAWVSLLVAGGQITT